MKDFILDDEQRRIIACDAAEKITSFLREAEGKRHALMQNEIYNPKYAIADALEQSRAMYRQKTVQINFVI